MKKRILFAGGLTVLAALVWGFVYLNSLLPIITGYPAKYLCSAVFISNRVPAEVEAVDLNFSFIQYVTSEVNYQEKSVTSRFLWGKSTAIYREGFGCTLLRETDAKTLKETIFPAPAGTGYNQDKIDWPMGNMVPDSNTGIDKRALHEIGERVMGRKEFGGDPFAFVVLHQGIPAVERYKAGFSAKTRFLSWSMAKSFTNALAGIMVKDGLLDIHQKADVGQWKNDGRNQITINDLMQMQSGLEFNEEYGNRSDVTLMLYTENDFAGFAIRKPLEFKPGNHWYYASGSTNIVNYLMRKKFRDDRTYYSYAPTRLFDRIGMPDAVFETDPSGTLVGSSYLYATALDFARFGLLYLQDGVFNGERILPEGWVAYTTTPAIQSQGNYGSFFWLNRGNYYPSAPEDMYYCNGHDGQRIFIIPSKDLVVVVLGYSPKTTDEMNFNLLLTDILGTIERE
jgi:hypothetical protein